MRTAKILAVIVGGIVVLFVAATLAMWLLVNPNDYKGRIAAAVKQATGRDLVLTGDIKLSVFPRLALEMGPASLGNPPGFGDAPFLKFERAAVHVQLWPLLSKRLEMAGVELDGLDLRMRKNAAGKGNWEGFGGSKQPADSERPADSEPPTDSSPPGTSNIGQSLPNLAGIRVTNGRVSYQDMVIDKLNFETGAFNERGVLPITLGCDADLGAPGEHASVNGKFALSSDASGQEIKFDAVSLSGLASRPGGNQPTHWELSAPTIDVNLARQTLAAPSFALRYLGADVNGKLAGTKIIDDLSLTGSVTLAPLLLREFMPRMGITVPRIRDPHALSQLAASSDFAYDAKGVHLDKIQIQLDDTKLHGSVALLDGEARALKFDLAADKIDADRYLAPDGGATEVPDAKAAEKSASGSAAEASDAKVAEKRPGGGAKAADAKPMQADGTLTLGSLHFSKMDFTSMRMTVAMKDKVIHLFPTQALIDEGRYSGDITLDSRGTIPALSLDEHLAGINVSKLLAQGAAKNRFSGKGNVNIKATAHGAAADAIMKTLNGHFDANLADGAVEGVDLGYELGVAQALIDHKPQPQGSNTGRTKFDAFKMSAEIVNGVATTQDLTISSPVLRVTGKGSTNIPTKAIDFQVLATILKSPKETVADIPMKITGTYSDPTVRPDLEALAKGQLKQKLQNVLQDKLKSFFNK